MPVNIGHAEPGFEDPVGLMVACHRRIERFLRVLVDVTARCRGNALTNIERNALEVALKYFREAAPNHTADEEHGLFPALADAHTGADDDLTDLERDHRRAEGLHKTVDDLGLAWLGQGTLEDPDVQELEAALRELSELYRAHIAIEEKRVFPRARRTLSPEVLERLGRDMARRRGVAFIPPTVQLTLASAHREETP